MTKCIADCNQPALPTVAVCKFHLNHASNAKHPLEELENILVAVRNDGYVAGIGYEPNYISRTISVDYAMSLLKPLLKETL